MNLHQQYTGKQICEILKEIRQQVAFENDIFLRAERCSFQSICTGTCPKCEAELAYLNKMLKYREDNNKSIIINKYEIGNIHSPNDYNQENISDKENLLIL